MLQIKKINWTRFWQKIWVKAQELLYAQFFLTLCSWPILLWWGLPLSWLTLLGNLFFNPFIMVFLLFAVFLFFFELIGLPSGIWVFLLEHLTSLWLWFVAWGSHRALVAFPCPSVLVLAAIPFGAACIIYWWHNNRSKKVVYLGAFLLGTGFFLKLAYKAPLGIYPVPAGQKSLRFIYNGKQSFLADKDGALRNGTGLSSWIDFKLRPFLVKKFGLVSCDAIIIVRPTPARLKAAAVVARRLQIPCIIVPADKMSSILTPELVGIELKQLAMQDVNQLCHGENACITS